jgi:hypothetical protein
MEGVGRRCCETYRVGSECAPICIGKTIGIALDIQLSTFPIIAWLFIHTVHL